MDSSHEHRPGHEHGHEHEHGLGLGHDHEHEHRHYGSEPTGHQHPTGIRGFLVHLFVPHSHDASDSIDDALEASQRGIRAVKISLIGLGATALLQAIVVALSGSIALLADTIHNFSDALTAIPLWIAFSLSRRAPTRRYTWGFGRAEDLAGLFIVAMIALSAVIAAVESVHRLLEPRSLDHTGWVFAAGLVGFAGNELVALYRIRTGRRIGSAALVADGVHARTDGFTSLAVVIGVLGVWFGLPWADPAIGILISIAIVVLLVGTARDVGRRLLDGVDPGLTSRAADALAADPRILSVDKLRLRWNGHRLNLQATVVIRGDLSVDHFHALEHEVSENLGRALPGLGDVALTPTPDARA